ncbi:MAG: VOC family protein [Nitrospirota bacterium]|nr:VOC family protein [Nitrospirota bacterium]
MTKTTFTHVGMTCEDPIVIERFYTRHFDFKRTRVYEPGTNQVVMIKSGDVYLELFKATEEAPFSQHKGSGPEFPGLRHLAFLVDDLDSKIKEMGDDAQISLGPFDMSQYIPGMKACWIKDPEGNIIELNQGYVDENNPTPLDE